MIDLEVLGPLVVRAHGKALRLEPTLRALLPCLAARPRGRRRLWCGQPVSCASLPGRF